MISCDRVKILSPLFQLKHKDSFGIESICNWFGAALAVGFRPANMPLGSLFWSVSICFRAFS